MAGFLYFFPRPEPVSTVAQIPEPSLRELLADTSVNAAQNNRGPDGTAGQMIAPMPAVNSGGVDATCGFWPDRQTWHPVEDSKETTNADGTPGEPIVLPPRYWIGWETTAPPRPVDLQRSRLVSGHSVRLGDGNDWIIPVCGPVNRSLPQSFLPAPGKKLTMRVVRQYQAIAAESEKWFDIVGRAEEEFTWMDAFNYATNLLAINYRLGWYEAGFLGLITTDIFVEILTASLGEPERRMQMVVQKKMTDEATPPAASAASPGA